MLVGFLKQIYNAVTNKVILLKYNLSVIFV